MRSRPAVAARLSYLALFAAVGASFPYLSVFFQDRGLDLGQIGLMTALGAAAGLVAAPVWGAIADRFAGSPFIISAASVVSAAGAVGLVLVDGIGPMVVALAILSVAFAGIAPTLDARALETVGNDRDRYGRIRAWGSASFIVAVFVTGAVIERAGVPSMFAIYVAALLALALASVPLRGSRSAATLPRLSGIGVVLRHGPIARFLPAALLVWSAAMSINWYFSIHLLDLGAPGELVGSAWAIGALVEIPVMSAYPSLAARIGGGRLLLLGGAAFALRVIVLAVVTDPVAAAATMALHGVAFALVLVGGVTYVSRHAPQATAATAQGILSATVFSVAMIIGPGVGSWVAESFGIAALFGVGIAASLAGVPALWWATRGDRMNAAAITAAAAPIEGAPSTVVDMEAGR
ncbi:MAG TPA: MFS transporter [Candidatus Limnocylindria bacterium]|nr:MFS transporter [Candidatus Limnocylindria bacterium]